jgi:hypothetical protein
VTNETAASATAESFDDRVRWVYAAAEGRLSQIELMITTHFVHVGESGRDILSDSSALHGAIRKLPGYLADFLPPDKLAEVPVLLAGTVNQICDTLAERRERYGFSYWVVHEESLEDFAPIVARLTGIS